MFKISIADTEEQRRLVLEGRLVYPWTAELEPAWRAAGEQLRGRSLVVDLANVTQISCEGETALLKLMRHGAIFCSRGVLTSHVVQRLARRCRCRS